MPREGVPARAGAHVRAADKVWTVVFEGVFTGRAGESRKGVRIMTRYAIFFSLTAQTIGRFIDQPSDRAAAVRALLEPVGGRLISYDFMFGEDDGMVVFEVPDSQTAAAISLAVSSTGAFNRLRTHELIPAENLSGVVERARSARQNYRPPGAAAS